MQASVEGVKHVLQASGFQYVAGIPCRRAIVISDLDSGADLLVTALLADGVKQFDLTRLDGGEIYVSAP
jgi:hypothetical protein